MFKYILLLISYLLGAIPFSVILGKKFKGIDIRNHGSGNPGGTNALRFLGKRVGFIIVILDGLKGGLIILLIHLGVFDGFELFHPLAYGTIAAFGHVFSVFIGFKGGKAVAASVGMVIAYNFIWAVIMFTVFMLVLKFTKYVSLASTSALVTMLLLSIIWFDWGALPFSLLLMILVIYRHQSNYKNIRNGVEPKVKWI